jgi:hypothetical protein
MNEYIALGVSVLTLLLLTGKEIFGGGNALAAKFAELDKSTTTEISKLRVELTARVDNYEDNYGVGLDAIKSSIHAMQLGLLEFRAKMAEDYMHKDDYAAGITDVKSQLRDSFKKVEDRLGRIEENMHHGSNTNGPRLTQR